MYEARARGLGGEKVRQNSPEFAACQNLGADPRFGAVHMEILIKTRNNLFFGGAKGVVFRVSSELPKRGGLELPGRAQGGPEWDLFLRRLFH